MYPTYMYSEIYTSLFIVCFDSLCPSCTYSYIWEFQFFPDKYPARDRTKINASSFIVFAFYGPVKNFSFMSGQVFLGTLNQYYKQIIKCPAQGHNTVTLPGVRLELHVATLGSKV